MIQIEASILSADFGRLGEQAHEAEAAGADAIQIDVMDGRFVPNIRSHVTIPLDIHLMIIEPERHVAAFVDAGANRIIVHQEACLHLHRVLQSLRERNIEAGVSINPGTPLGVLEEVLDMTDFIQIMTVNPGWGGQKFIESQLGKVRQLRDLLQERNLNTPVAVDGGIGITTAPRVVKAGATVLVAGSSIYNGEASVADNMAALRKSVHK
jgi:ribulose-phosphate 3-epimerase